MALTMAEEILLLLLDDETGRLRGLPGPVAELALAGGLIMELALAGRVDTDLDGLVVVRHEPLGDPLLDETLARIATVAPDRTAAGESGSWRAGARCCARRCWTSWPRRASCAVCGTASSGSSWTTATPGRKGARTPRPSARLHGVLLDDEIPEPRDATMIGAWCARRG